MTKSRQVRLGLFAKWPAPGQVKTRLASATSPEWAACLADAFLGDALRQWESLPGRILAIDPPQRQSDFARRAGPGWQIVVQAAGGLGQRLGAFFQQFSPAVVLGTDSPTLPRSHVLAALQALETTDVVLGPATDGGYYLIGCRDWLPELFAGVAWGGEQVLKQTVERLPPGKSLHLLPPWYDVDTLADVHFLWGHLAAARRAGDDLQAPHTEQLLHTFFSCPPGRQS
jgi:rSAM/selenodomain-associated transferase 1